MSGAVLSSGVDRTAFRTVGWDEHVANHDIVWREYWLSRPVSVRLAGAMRCRWRVHGQLPRVDRSHFRVIDPTALDR